MQKKPQKNNTKQVFQVLDKIGNGLKKYGLPVLTVVVSVVTLGKANKKS